MVFYFSGTGNSRFCAKRISEAIGQETSDIATYMRSGEYPSLDEPGVYVFVCPSYMSAPARSMTEFIEKTAFPSGVRAYFVVTCAASMGITPRVCSELSVKKGFEYMGSAQVKMPQNYIALFTTKQVEENIDILEKAENEIEKISASIVKGVTLDSKKVGAVEYSFTKWVRDVYYKDFMNTAKFRATDKCISCRKCVNICPLSNITMKDDRPSWGRNCTHCMACINQCPADAIEYGKGTAGRPRYKGPDSTLGAKNPS